jgi:hypothetical protein
MNRALRDSIWTDSISIVYRWLSNHKNLATHANVFQWEASST